MLIKFLDDYKELKTDRRYLLEGIAEVITDLEKLKESANLSMEDRYLLANILGTLNGIKRGAEQYGYKGKS